MKRSSTGYRQLMEQRHPLGRYTPVRLSAGRGPHERQARDDALASVESIRRLVGGIPVDEWVATGRKITTVAGVSAGIDMALSFLSKE